MDYKAKYEEALEKARVIYKGRKAMHYTDEVSDLESLFPELTEANDEMMIEAIIEALDSHCNSINHLSARGYQMEDVEAWLEKKKDSIPYEKYVEDIAVINAEAKTKYHAGWNDGYEAKQKEQKPKEWNEKPCLTCDEYDKGYKQGYTEGCTAGYNKAMLEQPKQEWSEEDKEIIGWACCYLGDYAASFKDKNERKSNMLYELSSKLNSLRTQPKVEWSEDIIRKAVKEVGLTQHQIDWFKTNVFPPKQEWSEEEKKRIRQNGRLDVCYNPEKYGLCHKIDWGEEDERMLSRCVKSIESSKQFADSDTFKKAKDHEIDWLENRIKSLRPQPKCLPGFDEMTPEEKMNHPLYLEGFDVGRDVGKVETDWKPSEEQMKALQNAVALTACDKELVKLYNQLKKLMEE